MKKHSITGKITRRVWWLQHRRIILLTLAALIGAAIFAVNFIDLITM